MIKIQCATWKAMMKPKNLFEEQVDNRIDVTAKTTLNPKIV